MKALAALTDAELNVFLEEVKKELRKRASQREHQSYQEAQSRRAEKEAEKKKRIKELIPLLDAKLTRAAIGKKLGIEPRAVDYWRRIAWSSTRSSGNRKEIRALVESGDMKSVHSMDIDKLALSHRSQNALWNSNIFKVGDLLSKSPSELLQGKSFGRRSLKEVEDVLEGLGLELKE